MFSRVTSLNMSVNVSYRYSLDAWHRALFERRGNVFLARLKSMQPNSVAKYDA